jgi:predicted ATPase with chaperone activity
MGVIDNEVQRLHDVVSALEKRVEQLEERRTGEVKSADGLRMILIGPPGAGKALRPLRQLLWLNWVISKCSPG